MPFQPVLPLRMTEGGRLSIHYTMKIKSLLAKPFASYVHAKIRKGMHTALSDQEAILKNLVKTGKAT